MDLQAAATRRLLADGTPAPRGAASGSFAELCLLYAAIGAEPKFLQKTALVAEFLRMFRGDAYLLIKMLLPNKALDHRAYGLKDKTMAKLFGGLFGVSADAVLTHAKQGDVSLTAEHFFSASRGLRAASVSTLSLCDVYDFLTALAAAGATTADAQFRALLPRCTSADLRWLVRLIKHDVKSAAGPKHVLAAIAPSAFEAFRRCSDVGQIVARYYYKIPGEFSGAAGAAADGRGGDGDDSDDGGTAGSGSGGGGGGGGAKTKLARSRSIDMKCMVPVKPMLAEACKSMDGLLKEYPGGLFAELKYDGERVQAHYTSNAAGANFAFFARSLKPVKEDKVADVRAHLPAALPGVASAVLDAEVLLVDKSGALLKFGSLGVHKRKGFVDACVCLFIFDILALNGKSLLDVPYEERRRTLESTVAPVPRRIQLSQTAKIGSTEALEKLMRETIGRGEEGLVLKDARGTYEPGKRHWLKIKRDYLADGAMADSADLVVLGAYMGTGSKSGIMSVFLMGCFDEAARVWKTVCKCGNGHDDATLACINKELNTIPIPVGGSPPHWLSVHSSLVPDRVVADPWAAPVWEITGAEFSTSEHHTAGGISIRFPRVTAIRTDKDAKAANTLEYLKKLVKNSAKVDTSLLAGASAGAGAGGGSARGQLTIASAMAKHAAAYDPVEPRVAQPTADAQPKSVKAVRVVGVPHMAGCACEKCTTARGAVLSSDDDDGKTGTDTAGVVGGGDGGGGGGDGGGGGGGDGGGGERAGPGGNDTEPDDATVESSDRQTEPEDGAAAVARPAAAAPAPSLLVSAPAQNPSGGLTLCPYGAACYRQNPAHRREYFHAAPAAAGPAHVVANLPVCPYGLACYRKNPAHKLEYQHIAMPAAPPTAGSRKRAKRGEDTGSDSAGSGEDGSSDDEDSEDDEYTGGSDSETGMRKPKKKKSRIVKGSDRDS